MEECLVFSDVVGAGQEGELQSIPLGRKVSFFRMEGSFESTPSVYLANASALFSSSAMTASAIRPPSVSHSIAIAGSPCTLMGPFGPGIFMVL